jgi:hypothetical protein
MARKELKSKVGVVAQLKAIVNGDTWEKEGGTLKYAVVRELIDMGYVAEAGRVTTQAVKDQGRGRKKIVYGPTARGKALLNLSKSWKAKTAA